MGSICPKACCGKRYGGNQAKNHLSDHLHKVCIPRNGALTPREKDALRRYDMAECSKCHRWFTRRNRDKHQRGCTVGESPDEERPKPGRYGEYGDEVVGSLSVLLLCGGVGCSTSATRSGSIAEA